MSKFLLLAFLTALSLSANAQDDASAPPGLSPLALVNQRMRYYNERQLDAMIALYSDEVEVYAYPDRLLGRGKAHLRVVMEDTFKSSTRVTTKLQLVRGNFVLNEEEVTYGGKERSYISIYEVRDGLIRSVRFIRD